jgi:predicted GNAT family acetyltransferase
MSDRKSLADEILTRPPLTLLERDTAPQLAVDSWISIWAQNARTASVDLRHEDGLTLFTTGLPDDNLNRVLETRLTSETAEAGIDRAAAHFAARGVPFIWTVGPTSEPANLPELLRARGFRLNDSSTGMMARLDALPATELPASLTIEEVADTESHERWMQRWTAGFPDWAVANWSRLFVDHGFAPDRTLRRYLGWWDGEPVATSALALGAGLATIECVGTIEALRGRGIGTAMTVAPLLEARRHGFRIAALLSSTMGRGLYERLGFRACGTFEFFRRPDPASA